MKGEIDCRCSITFITHEMGGEKKKVLKGRRTLISVLTNINVEDLGWMHREPGYYSGHW